MGPSLMPAWGDGMFDTNGYTSPPFFFFFFFFFFFITPQPRVE